jgi:hypothetical protein
MQQNRAGAGMDTLNHLSLQILAQAQDGTDPLVAKGLDSAVSFSQSLSQWAYITIGASVALLFKDLAQRPKNHFIRWSFLIFLPGWFFLGWAIYEGARVHGAYIAYLMNQRHDPGKAIQTINADAVSQVSALEWGLAFFFLWLVIYLFWWITHRDKPTPNENQNRP